MPTTSSPRRARTTGTVRVARDRWGNETPWLLIERLLVIAVSPRHGKFFQWRSAAAIEVTR